MTFPVSFYHHQANDPSVNFDEVENRVEALEEVSLDVKTWVAGAAGSPGEICTDHVRDPGRNPCLDENLWVCPVQTHDPHFHFGVEVAKANHVFSEVD